MARILEDKKERELRKHLQAIESRLQDIYSLRDQVENVLMAETEKAEKVEDWGVELDARVERFKNTVEMTNDALSGLDSDKEKEKIERERQEEELRLQRGFEEDKRIEDMRLQIREQRQPKHSEDKTGITQERDMKVKPSETQHNKIQWSSPRLDEILESIQN